MSVRRTFDARLKELDNILLAMGKTAEEMLTKAVQALNTGDEQLADEVIALDDTVDRYNLQIETDCVQLIATQQPAARDLRVIFASVMIAGEVERVADYALDVAEVAKSLAGQKIFKPLVDIPKMAELVKAMLRDSLEAFVTRDLELIKRMINEDDKVDALYKYLFNELADFMKKDSALVDQCVQLLTVTRYLERIADHITNIGERVYYVETGELKELH